MSARVVHLPRQQQAEALARLIRSAEKDLARARAVRRIALGILHGDDLTAERRRQILEACLRLQSETARLRSRALLQDRRLVDMMDDDILTGGGDGRA